MMKLLLPFFTSLLLFFIVFPSNYVFADSLSSQSAAPAITTVPDYTLPYPGILPDNPLYVLKVFRDRLILFFISSSTKKSSFFLLQSDKRLAASWYLLKRDGKSTSLALTTLSKSTNYLSQALDAAKQAEQNREDMGDLKARLHSAVAKHVAVVTAMTHLQGATQRDSLNQEEKRLAGLQEDVEEFSSKQ